MYFFERAFRSFFLGGALFSVVAMLTWWQAYPASSVFAGVSGVYWHAHEMVFGYALATVSGFLLTAVMNWSGQNSASGWKLACLFFLWLGARIAFLADFPLVWVMGLDMAFTFGLFVHFFWPVWRRRLWNQAGLAAKFLLIIVANALFYGGATGLLENGEQNGILLGLFLVLAINLTMMRRLMPFFTEKALQLRPFKQSKWIDSIALGGFLLLMVLAVWWPHSFLMALTGLILAGVHGWRWWSWYHPRIWSVVLIWPLYLSYAFMIMGMALYGLVGLGWIPATVAIHALAAGGIGLLCSAILARIALGHTNRNVFEPPQIAGFGVGWVFALLAINGTVRVFMPWLDPANYVFWIGVSQWGWALAFMGLLTLYGRILLTPGPKRSHGVLL